MVIVQQQVSCDGRSNESSNGKKIGQVVNVLMRRQARKRGADLVSHRLSVLSRRFQASGNWLLRRWLRWLLRLNEVSTKIADSIKAAAAAVRLARDVALVLAGHKQVKVYASLRISH